MADNQNHTRKMILIPALWPDDGNYARFCAISADFMPPTLAEFRQTVLRRIAEKGLSEVDLVKIEFDPDELARWCRANGRAIDTKARADYAASIVKAALDGADKNRASGRRDQ